MFVMADRFSVVSPGSSFMLRGVISVGLLWLLMVTPLPFEEPLPIECFPFEAAELAFRSGFDLLRPSPVHALPFLKKIITRTKFVYKNKWYYNTRTIQHTKMIVLNYNMYHTFSNLHIFLYSAPGLSNRIKIESYFLIKSNVFVQIESNHIQIKSNDFFNFRYNLICCVIFKSNQMTFQFSIQFDLIRSGQRPEQENP